MSDTDDETIVVNGARCRWEYAPGPVLLPIETSPTLGGGHAHIYVTRAATLEFCALTHLHFEESRRELTRLLLPAVPVPGERRRWTFRVGMPPSLDRQRWPELGPEIYTLVAYVVSDGDLLVVANVSLAQDAPRVHSSGPPSEASP
jgi:hypothetical protein